jgi:hypothetical protein
MLPSSHKQHYQAFQQTLAGLIAALESLDSEALEQRVSILQNTFQQDILLLPTDDLEPMLVRQVQSYHTEIHKQLQLLKVDVAFLQAARRPETVSQRRSQICDRLQKLIEYCAALLN